MNIYDSSSKWMDDKFGFCVFQDKKVQFHYQLCLVANYLLFIPVFLIEVELTSSLKS